MERYGRALSSDGGIRFDGPERSMAEPTDVEQKDRQQDCICLVGEGFPHDSYCLLARLGPSEGQDEDLLRESMEALERLECQFWACAGPTLTPEAMRTCFRCSLLARLREHFGLTVCHVEETPVWTEAQRILSVARAGGREMTVEEAMAFASEPL